MPKARISVTIDEEVLERLDEEVKRTGSSRSFIINQLLRKHFEMDYILSK